MSTVDVDVAIFVIRINTELNLGHSSVFTTTAHPGTGRTISGWKWDEKTWSSPNEIEALTYSPALFDPSISGLDSSYYQSGYGDNDDLLLLDLEEIQASGQAIWTPKINHGHYYIGNEEHYLYSDQHRTEDVLLTNVVSGTQYHTLQKIPKPSVPIHVRNYMFLPLENRYSVGTTVRKCVEFKNTGPEYILDTSVSPPKLQFNSILNSAVGGTVSGSDGSTDVDDIRALELLGYSNGEANQEFFTVFSPLDKSQNVEVWSWLTPSAGYQWTVISGQQDFDAGDNNQVYIDFDHGILKFGDYSLSNPNGSGAIPDYASSIGIYYTKGFEVKYEPINSINYILPIENIDLNPMYSSTQYGFVQLSTTLQEPSSVVLSSTLERVNPYLIDLGNLTGEIKATVYSSNSVGLDGQEVIFEILSPILGTFGGVATSTRSVTTNGGVAQTLYHSPTTIGSLGISADDTDVTVASGLTTINFEGLSTPDSVSGLYLYKIHTHDEALGIAQSSLASYYTDYITEEGITSGEQTTQSYEEDYRSNFDMLTPTTYAAGDITTGKKTLIMTTQTAGVMDPHTGLESSGVYIPLFPISVSGIGTTTSPILEAIYDTELEEPGTGSTKAYFGVGDAITTLRAYVVHPRTGSRIYSNTINIKVQLPDTINGTFFADALSEINSSLLTKVTAISGISTASINTTSGNDDLYYEYMQDKLLLETYEEWFRRTRIGDTVGLTSLASEFSDPTLSGLHIIEPQTPTSDIIIPLGFRLQSAGITAASVLDQITYIDPNDPLVSGVFDTSSGTFDL